MNEDMRRTLATPREFSWGGKTFLIAPWKNKFLAAYAAWVEGRAERRLQAKLKVNGPAWTPEYERHTRDLRRDADGGGYEWGSEIVTNSYARLGSEGNRHLTHLTLQVAEPGLPRSWVDDFYESDPKEWKRLWEEVLGPLNFPPDVPAPDRQPEAGATEGMETESG